MTSTTIFAPDIAYDPIHDCYLVVSEKFDQFNHGPRIIGQFTGRSGTVIGAPVDLGPHTWMHRVAYSPDVPDGGGGRGGFVVVTGIPNDGREDVNRAVNSQIVSYPGRLVGSPTTIFTAPPDSQIWKVDIAYSPTAQRFLAAVGFMRGFEPIGPANIPVRAIMLDLEARPISDVPISTDPNPAPYFHEFYWSRNEIRAVWNPVSDEFGVLFTYDNQRTLARVRSDGTVRGRTALGLGAFFGDLEVATHTGHYLAIGASNRTSIDGVEVGADGTTLERGKIVDNVCVDPSCLPQSTVLSYSPVVGTFLLVAAKTVLQEVTVTELNQHGVPISSMSQQRGPSSFVTAHPSANEWSLGDLILGSHSLFGGSDATLGGCVGADPFTSVGGGVCVGRAWVPRGHPLAPPVIEPGLIPPPLIPIWCTITDPFTSLGGGVCVGGGWVPRGHPLAGAAK